MKTRTRTAAAGVLVGIVGMLVAGSTPAASADELPLAVAAGGAFATEVVVLPVGEGLAFTQMDPMLHDLVSATITPKGKRLFGTAQPLGISQSAPVLGVEDLSAGEYGFLCTIHPYMEGTLKIVPDAMVP
jgi:plastocyanin